MGTPSLNFFLDLEMSEEGMKEKECLCCPTFPFPSWSPFFAQVIGCTAK
jgi:hypothetical protein